MKMMSSKVEYQDMSEDLNSGRLLHDIEEISRALYLHKTPSKNLLSSSVHQSKSLDNACDTDSKSNVILKEIPQKDKKSSIWNWKPLKALTHIRSHRLDCCFFLHVHAIEGLPPNFNDLNLTVNWKRRKGDELRTRPARVCQGLAEFEETLMFRCSVYGNRNGRQNLAKYEPKLFLLNASAVGAPMLDIGRHWIDLTRLLPLTLEELEEERRTSGKWTTSFKLTGKAKGATMNVSFGFSLLRDKSIDPYSFVKVPDSMKGHRPDALDRIEDSGRISTSSRLRRLASVPRNLSTRRQSSSRSMDFKIIDETFPNGGPELARSVSFLYRKIEEENLGNSGEVNFFSGHLEPLKPKSADFYRATSENNQYDNTEISVKEHEIQFSLKKGSKTIQDAGSSDNSVVETIDVSDIFRDIETDCDVSTNFQSTCKVGDDDTDVSIIDGCKHEKIDTCFDEVSIEELESVYCKFLTSESAVIGSSLDVGKFVLEESNISRKSSFREGKMVRSLSLDNLAESVANEFLNMLDFEQYALDTPSDSGPESPREHLLRQFEEESLALVGNSIFEFNATAEQMKGGDITTTCYGRVACSDDFDLSLFTQEAEDEQNARQSLRSKRNAKMLENLETETLMREWGLDETDFHNSPSINSGGFGSPIHLTPEETPDLPLLGDGLGPIIWTKDGGLLRSMNPLLFRNAKNGARLVMQVSSPVVLPSMLGSNIMEILECWASGGVETMYCQANELMPLEDITEKTIQQVLRETDSKSKVLHRLILSSESLMGCDLHGTQKKKNALLSVSAPDDYSSSVYNGEDSDCVSYDYSSFVYNEKDSGYASLKDLVPLATAKVEILSVEGLRILSSMSDRDAPSSIRPSSGNFTSSGKSGIFTSEEAQRLQLLDVNGFDEIIKLSLSLDEWIKLDDGDFIIQEQTNEQIMKILAAHHSKAIDISTEQIKMDWEQFKLLGRSGGLLGKNFTLALRLQLRDPFRNYEMVGASMLALTEVERIYVPMPEEEDGTISESNTNEEETDLDETLVGSQGNSPMFKICKVYVAGLNCEPGDKKTRVGRRQQQSGTRWLLSSGMARSNKGPVSKSKAIVVSSLPMMKKVSSEDILWSISSNIQGAAANCKDLSDQNIYVRNPDIIFPNESVRLRKE